MAKFDSEAFGRQMAQAVRAAVNERLGGLEKRIAALETARVADLEAEVQRLRGRADYRG